jgi:VWFA-related protein
MTAIPPGAGSRSLRRGLVLALMAIVLSPHSPSAQQRPFVERVEVARVLIDARVFDDRGREIPDLNASNFAVKIDGRAVRVESAEWVGSTRADRADAPESAPPATSSAIAPDTKGARVPPRGRLVVFLVQKDLSPSRMTGLMQMAHMVDRLLAPFTREDRVAVLSFDFRLHIWTDFTNDLEAVRSVLAEDVLLRHPGPVAASDGVSLLARLDLDRGASLSCDEREQNSRKASHNGLQSAARISGIEHALRHIAELLEPLPGAKSLVLLGYGFGRFDARSGGVTLMDGYDQASAALQRARVAVFTLNVTQAHYNSLQVGLQAVAAETGGVYTSTYEFPSLAIQRLSHALAGHYVLFVEKPDYRKGEHRIEVRLTGRRGTVIARTSYVDDR